MLIIIIIIMITITIIIMRKTAKSNLKNQMQKDRYKDRLLYNVNNRNCKSEWLIWILFSKQLIENKYATELTSIS